jgi:hypothetical protein
VTLSTGLDPDDALADGVEEGTIVTCRLHDLPLKPGAYNVSAMLRGPRGLIDSVANRGDFTIVPSDFFGTGVPVTDSFGSPVLTRQHWQASVPSAARGDALVQHKGDG